MKIRTALTIKNMCVTATVFLACLLTIYIVSEHTRRDAFFYDLKGEALTKAHLFLQNQVDASTMQSIYLNNKQFINEVEVAIYTPDFDMLYHDAIQNDIIKEDRAMIDRILREGDINLNIGEYQGVGTVYNYDGKEYIVTAAAYDGYGRHNLAQLRKTLVVLFLVGLILLFISGYLLARMSLKPIRQIVAEAEEITGKRIDRRLVVKNKKDELGELCTTFNNLLSRLEVSFNSQKQFVSNVSHELRTPLAALMAELDLALQRERSGDQYRRAISNSLDDAKRMTRLIEGLLNLAKADYQKEGIKMDEIRLDELLLDVRQYILKAHPDYHIELLFDQEESTDDNMITVNGNLYLLSIAFSNLIENNCKYSENHTSVVQISFWEKWAIVRLSDNGFGMNEIDKEKLFNLFYRGEQEDSTEGHGIGMTLAQKIIHLHDGSIDVHSQKGEGTTYIINLPHL